MDLLQGYQNNYFNPYFSFNPMNSAFAAAPSAASPPQVEMQAILGEVIQALTQLTRAWGGMTGQNANGNAGGFQPAGGVGNAGNAGGALNGNPYSPPFMLGDRRANDRGGYPTSPYGSLYGSDPNSSGGSLYGGTPGQGTDGGSLYGGAPGQGAGSAGSGGGAAQGGPSLPPPADPREIASYLQMQVKGGALEGKTSISEKDAIPGTDLATTKDPTMWNAGVARAYTYQFAAQAAQDNYNTAKGTYDPLSANGVQNGIQAFNNMSPDAKLFTQVASVYKGNLLNGPGSYDNSALGNLLMQKAQATGDPQLAQLAYSPNVGQTDVQTIGAVTNALNSGKISLNDIIASGAIPAKDMARYQQVIGYVTSGTFNQDLGKLDTNYLSGGQG